MNQMSRVREMRAFLVAQPSTREVSAISANRAVIFHSRLFHEWKITLSVGFRESPYKPYVLVWVSVKGFKIKIFIYFNLYCVCNSNRKGVVSIGMPAREISPLSRDREGDEASGKFTLFPFFIDF